MQIIGQQSRFHAGDFGMIINPVIKRNVPRHRNELTFFPGVCLQCPGSFTDIVGFRALLPAFLGINLFRTFIWPVFAAWNPENKNILAINIIRFNYGNTARLNEIAFIQKIKLYRI